LVKNPSIILNDNDTIKELLGANDQNLKLIQELIGFAIYSQGNEIFLDTDNVDIYNKLKSMLDQLQDYIKSGKSICPDLIRSLYKTVFNGEAGKTEILKSTEVVVPRSLKRIFPRTYNQALYIEAMNTYDMVLR
jgi:phosphate starvation-inducible PhoH-like protein